MEAHRTEKDKLATVEGTDNSLNTLGGDRGQVEPIRGVFYQRG